MPLCGFDEQMLDGIEMFYRGLAEAAIRKSTEEVKMPLCGFDEHMLDGLDKVYTGLAKSVTENSETTE
ncbi:MAG: hypothetical protein KKD17_04365 [Nanoarchaeota archaeon]|nr:hypothetical protein [Nanoarchaeota archaeon]